VRHPFVGVSSLDVSKRLAEELGVVTLPSAFFDEDKGRGEDLWERTRWIRFSVANVDEEKVKLLCERLKFAEDKFGWTLD